MKFLATPIAHAVANASVFVDVGSFPILASFSLSSCPPALSQTQRPSGNSDLLTKASRTIFFYDTSVLIILSQAFAGEAPTTVIATHLGARLLSLFAVHRSLASSAHGQIWAATFVPTGQIYAIKVVPFAEKSWKVCQALRREVNMLSRASTIPGAVRVHLSAYDAHSAFFVTDLYRAGSLAQFLAGKGRLTCRQAVFYLQQLLKIIERFHANGIVHGDITPENVFVEDDGTLVLGEVGAALPFDVPNRLANLAPDARADGLVRLTPLFAVGGTPAFMAPEIWRREGYGPAVDYWAAVLCYFVIRTGRVSN
jgi:serine/threonine protein kinase